MTRIYNMANIKALFEEFTDEELQRLSQEPDLKPVYEQLPPNSDRLKIVELLLKHAIQTFLTSAEKYNPDKYIKHQPYYKITTLDTPSYRFAKSKRENKMQKKPLRIMN